MVYRTQIQTRGYQLASVDFSTLRYTVTSLYKTNVKQASRL